MLSNSGIRASEHFAAAYLLVQKHDVLVGKFEQYSISVPGVGGREGTLTPPKVSQEIDNVFARLSFGLSQFEGDIVSAYWVLVSQPGKSKWRCFGDRLVGFSELFDFILFWEKVGAKYRRNILKCFWEELGQNGRLLRPEIGSEQFKILDEFEN